MIRITEPQSLPKPGASKLQAKAFLNIWHELGLVHGKGGVDYLQRNTDAAMTVRVYLKGAIEHRMTSQAIDGKYWL